MTAYEEFRKTVSDMTGAHDDCLVTVRLGSVREAAVMLDKSYSGVVDGQRKDDPQS